MVRFVRDLTYEPPRLRELAARCVKIHRLPCGEGELPPALLAYLDTARRCVNPRCKGEALFCTCKGDEARLWHECPQHRRSAAEATLASWTWH